MTASARRPGIRVFLAGAMAGAVLSARAADEKAGAAAAGAADEAWRTQAKASLDKGLNWLKTRQKPEGSWGATNFPAMTALGLWAFARSGHADRADICVRAAAFIERSVQPDGGIYRPALQGRGSGGLSVYNTALSISALHAYDRARYAPIILAARKFLAGGQLVGDSPGSGGFGYERPVLRAPAAPDAPRDPRAPRADLSNTAWALQAMRMTQDAEDLRPKGEAAVDVDWSSAIKFVEKLQNRDPGDVDNYGGFGYEAGGERGGAGVTQEGKVRILGYGSMTYAGLESMIYAQVDRNDPRVKSALHWAARHWSVDENPGKAKEGLFYYYNIMSKALSLTGSDDLQRPDGSPGDPIPWKSQLVGKLVNLQQPDGSWVNTDNAFWEGDPVMVTSFAVLTLEACGVK